MTLQKMLVTVATFRTWRSWIAAGVLLMSSPMAMGIAVVSLPPRADLPGLDPATQHLPQITTNISNPPRPPKDEALQAFGLDWLAPGNDVLILGEVNTTPGGLPTGWLAFPDVGSLHPTVDDFAMFDTVILAPISLAKGVLSASYGQLFSDPDRNAFTAALLGSNANILSLEGAGLDLFGFSLLPVGGGRSVVQPPAGFDGVVTNVIVGAQVPEPSVPALLAVALLAWCTGQARRRGAARRLLT